MKVTTTRSGLDVNAAMTRAAAAAPRLAANAAEEAADLIATRARRLVPSRTGRMRGSIRVDTGGGAATVVAGGSRAKYFGWVDYGGLLRKQNIRRPYRSGGRYVYPAADQVWPKVIGAAEDAAAAMVRAGGLG